MIVFPNCKINLGLTIAGKRPDGYHNLETVFYPLPLRDILEVIRQPQRDDDTHFSASGLPVQGQPEQNLCMRALRLLQKDFPQIAPVQVHLHKLIPMGAGLGGGSADGAFMLQLLNTTFHLKLSEQQLSGYAAQLGSDCPFFIYNKPCLATGRGELLEPIALDLSAWSVLLVHPHVHIDTAWAFAQITPANNRTTIGSVIHQPVHTWKEQLVNDFEAPVCKQYPALREVKESLYAAGAVYASMTGSGSCFYGLFPRGPLPRSLSLPAHYTVYPLTWLA